MPGAPKCSYNHGLSPHMDVETNKIPLSQGVILPETVEPDITITQSNEREAVRICLEASYFSGILTCMDLFRDEPVPS